MALDPLLDPGSDFLDFDFIEDMTIRIRKADESGFDDYEGIRGLPRVGSDDEAELSGQSTNTFHLHKADIDDAGVTLRPRDRIVRENGDEYVVQLVDSNTLETRLRVPCKKITPEPLDD